MRTFICQDNCVDDLMIYCVKMRGVACCFWQSHNQAFNNLHLLNIIMLMIDQLLKRCGGKKKQGTLFLMTGNKYPHIQIEILWFY